MAFILHLFQPDVDVLFFLREQIQNVVHIDDINCIVIFIRRCILARY